MTPSNPTQQQQAQVQQYKDMAVSARAESQRIRDTSDTYIQLSKVLGDLTDVVSRFLQHTVDDKESRAMALDMQASQFEAAVKSAEANIVVPQLKSTLN